MASNQHPASLHDLPAFIAAPGQTDVLFVVMAFVLVCALVAAGVFFFWLHSLPERMVHNRIQFDIVAVLVLLSLFTHVHAFWIVALLLALIKFPEVSQIDFIGPLRRIAAALETPPNPAALPANAGTAAAPASEASPTNADTVVEAEQSGEEGRLTAPKDGERGEHA